MHVIAHHHKSDELSRLHNPTLQACLQHRPQLLLLLPHGILGKIIEFCTHNYPDSKDPS